RVVAAACETVAREVFDAKDAPGIIPPPAMSAEFTKPLTPSIIVAAEGCPVDVIQFENIEVESPAPLAAAAGAAAAAGPGEVSAKAPAPKQAAPLGPPDPKWQALAFTRTASQVST